MKIENIQDDVKTDVPSNSNAGPSEDSRPRVRQFQDAVPLLGIPELLRERASRDGFLFMKGLLNKDKIAQLRKEMLAIIKSHGLLDSSHELSEGFADVNAVNRLTLDRDDVGTTAEIYLAVQRLKRFQAMLHDPALLAAMRVLFGAEPFPHPMTIGRIMLPHAALRATPPHQDFIHIQGTRTTWTAWFPVGDCPKELGGLSMLAGSHEQGVLDVAAHGGAGGLETILCDLDLEWAEGDYEMGDVILFNSLTVHKALPNKSPGKIRLSCDFRYQPAHLEIDPRSLGPHVATWEEIYAGWPGEEWKYYWKEAAMPYSQWDESIRWQKEKIC